MASEKKILFTTVYKRYKNDLYDWIGSNTRVPLSFSIKRINSFGLRFIKQNIPSIEILEYPLWEEYSKKVKENKWDIVGFSFYLNEIHEILEMVEYAKQIGVKEIWAGNYGSLTEEIQDKFDKVFNGYAEEEISKEIGLNHNKLFHPPLIWYFGTNIGFKLQTVGILFTSRGCTMGCDFCQTPHFCKKPYEINLGAIQQVLKYYISQNIDEVIILDENFGLLKKHTEEVVKLLGKLGFYWYVQTKVHHLNENLDKWIKNGFAGAAIGIESLNQDNLDLMSKHQKAEECIEVLKRMDERNRMVVGFYMLGFENDTKKSIKKDILKLSKLNLDLPQLCVVTPLPQTKLWNEIKEKYGIFDKNWRHFDAKHLVWNHPYITADEMKKILNWSFNKCHPLTRPFHTSIKFNRMYKERENNGLFGGIKRFYNSANKANKFNYFPKKIPLLKKCE